MRIWTILLGLSVSVYKLPNGPIPSIRILIELHGMSHGHLSRNHGSITVGDLCSVHCRKLLWYHGSISSHGHMCIWTILFGLGVGVYKLPNGPIPNICILVELHGMSHGHLSRIGGSITAGDLLSVHCW